MKKYWKLGGIAPRILNFGTRMAVCNNSLNKLLGPHAIDKNVRAFGETQRSMFELTVCKLGN
jgi:hypothetical protein